LKCSGYLLIAVLAVTRYVQLLTTFITVSSLTIS